MGHTLVTRFDPESRAFLHNLMAPFTANKIPFGRNCDREAANREMDYHLTLLHWAKTRDAYFLDCIRDFQPAPCRIWVTGMQVMCAEEGSWLLYFTVAPGPGFRELTASLSDKTQAPCPGFLHITLAVSQDYAAIEAIRGQLQRSVEFPFCLEVDGLDLYHIWRPTKKVRCL